MNDKGIVMPIVSNDAVESELVSLLTKISDQIARDRKAREGLDKKIAKDEELATALRAALAARKPSGGYGHKTSVMWEAIAKLSEARFTPDELEESIKLVNPSMEVNKANLRSALWKLARDKQLKLVRAGTNAAPAQYERIDAIVKQKYGNGHSDNELEDDPFK